MLTFEYYNEKTGEKLSVGFPDDDNNEENKTKTNVHYINYYPSENLLDWTSDHTYKQLLEAYNNNEILVARSSVGDVNFEGMEIEAQTRLLRLHKITSERVEFVDVDFYDGDMEALKLTHTIDNMITIRSLVVH